MFLSLSLFFLLWLFLPQNTKQNPNNPIKSSDSSSILFVVSFVWRLFMVMWRDWVDLGK